MSFIGPKMLTQIDACLCQDFPSHCTILFGDCSMILLGEFKKLTLVKDIPMYVGSSIGTALWRTFDTFITLNTIFQQQGNNPSQNSFRQLLLKVRNATPTIEDWALLITSTTSCLSHVENCSFQ